MSGPRFPSAGMLVAVALVGVAVAALRDPSEVWDSALLGTVFLALLTSTLLAIHRTGDRRAYWFGFALFGWAYLVGTLVPPVESRLPTTKGLIALRDALARPGLDWQDDLIVANARSFDVKLPGKDASPVPSPTARWDVTNFGGNSTAPAGAYTKRLIGLPGVDLGRFVRVGHSLVIPAFAMFGGILSRRLHRGSQGRNSSTAAEERGGHDASPAPGAVGG